MPSEREAMEQFKRDFPEQFEQQQKLAQEIFKDIPNRETPNYFGRGSAAETPPLRGR